MLRWLPYLCLCFACGVQGGAVKATCSDTNVCLNGGVCVRGECIDPEILGECRPPAIVPGQAYDLPFVVLVDRTVFTPEDCSATAQPGADIDAVLLYRGGRLIAAGKPGSATFAPLGACPADPVAADTFRCVTPTAPDGALAEGPVNANGSVGFVSLDGGSVALRFGECVNGELPGDCDGSGDEVQVQSGDEIDVYELDSWYTSADVHAAPATCKCTAEKYEVHLRAAPCSTAGELCLGVYQGTTSGIRVP